MVKIVIPMIAALLMSCTAFAQTCLHPSSGETTEQQARRRAALTAARTINNIQVNRPEARQGVFLQHDELASAPFAAKMPTGASAIVLTPGQDIVPGWRLTLDVLPRGYWFAVTDTTDPCHFTFISNNSGLIYTAEPLR
jgi:hypothetical protein